jgi:glyoxylase-like metal-dependent hydrolase (beta-lactamase superfamily II)
MSENTYDIDIVIQGFPGKSVCHGGLGWSSVVLLRGYGRVALVDTGSFGMRRLLIERLAKRGLKPQDVTDVLLTHSHHDHSVNWTLFRHARIVIGNTELNWSLNEPWGETPVPELYMRELNRWPSLVRALDGEQVLPSVFAHVAPGHTPGCLVFVAHDRTRDFIFTGDAAKNRAELLSRSADMTASAEQTAQSMAMIWEFWRRRPGNILVPGHDLPMTVKDGRPAYIGHREAAVSTWYGDDLEQTTLFELTRERAGAILAADD